MAILTIDGKEYDTDSLSDEAKTQLRSLRYVDSELNRLQAQVAALQTARIAYGRALKECLEQGQAPQDEEVSIEGGDTVRFD